MNFSNVPSGILLDTYWNTYWKDQSIYITGLDSSQKPVLLHFTSSGTWIKDPRFRSAGYLTLPANLAGGSFSGGISEFQDGSYFVNGTAANGSSFLIKYGSTGTVQNSFGSGGVIYGPTGYYLWANPSSSSSNGSILVQGNNGQDGSYYLAQYTSAGVLDTTFGSRGVLTLPNPPAGGINFIMTGIPVSD